LTQLSLEFSKWKAWKDYENNPLIKPEFPDWIIADPTFIHAEDSPDGLWHLFAHSIINGINHFISRNGLNWKIVKKKVFPGMRPFLFKEKDKFYLLFEEYISGLNFSVIKISESLDLRNWEAPKIILKPSLRWEWGFFKTNGNPCLIKIKNKYRLYYSAGSVFLKDCLFFEPKYIGIAESDSIMGPYIKKRMPILFPNKDEPYRNLGAGALKVIYLKEKKIWLGFNNGIYIDKFSKSRSSILLLASKDGLSFEKVFNTPIISPNHGWKRSFVYQLDVKYINNEYWMYYNARDGWFFGKERIGLSILKID